MQGKERQSLKAQVLKGSHSEKSTPLNEAHIINDLKNFPVDSVPATYLLTFVSVYVLM